MIGFKNGMLGIALACAGFTALPAAAQVQADITVSNLRYVMTDLTPGDGQASTFVFTDADFSPLSVSSAVTPQATEQNGHSFAERFGSFEFSGHTQVSLLLDVHIAMQAGFTPEQSGSVWLGFLGGASWGPPKDNWSRRDADEAYGDVGTSIFGDFVPTFNRDQTVSLTFTNDSDYAALGDFTIELESNAHALASPVPEAPAPAMLALGVGMLGLFKRRRKAA